MARCLLSWANHLLWNWLARDRVTGDDMHADVPAPAHEIADNRAMQKLEPA